MLVNAVAPFEGKLHWVGTPREGVSQRSGDPWKMVDFVLCYQDHQMQEKYIVFSLSGVERVDEFLRTPIGAQIRVSWIPDANSYTDLHGVVKWFPSYRALNIVSAAPQPTAQPQQAPYHSAPQTGYQLVAQQQGYQQQSPQQGTQVPPQTQPDQAYQSAPGQPMQPGIHVPTDDDCPF